MKILQIVKIDIISIMVAMVTDKSLLSINGFSIKLIYTIILLKSVCRCSQTAGCNSCSVVSGDVSNCSYREMSLTVRIV